MDDFEPLDLGKFRDIVRRESARLRLRPGPDEREITFTLALALSAAVKKIFYEKSATVFSDEPRIMIKPVVHYAQRMRIDAMEKYNAPSVFSVIQLGVNEEALGRQEYQMTVIIYLERKFLPEFLRLLQYPYIDSDDDLEAKDGCGAVVNLIVGQYKNEMAILGYKDLTMSHFESFINTAVDGVGIPKGVFDKYEIDFEIEEANRLVIEMMTLPSLPKNIQR